MCIQFILNCLFQHAFKLTTPNGGELLFQAAGIQDRDRWAHAIGAVIRSITSSSQASFCFLCYLQDWRCFGSKIEQMNLDLEEAEPTNLPFPLILVTICTGTG